MTSKEEETLEVSYIDGDRLVRDLEKEIARLNAVGRGRGEDFNRISDQNVDLEKEIAQFKIRCGDQAKYITCISAQNEEYHQKIVDLHTEIQEKNSKIDTLVCDVNIELDELQKNHKLMKSLALQIVDLIAEWLKSNKQPLGNLTALVDMANVLNDYDKVLALELDSPPGEIPAVVASAVQSVESDVNSKLPDGMSVKIMSQLVTPKQMSEMLKSIKED